MILEKEFNLIINHKKIIKIMQKYNLRTKIRRKNNFRIKLNETLSDKIYQNIINRNFNSKIPNSNYCTDITYINYKYNRAYLSVVKDISTGEIVSYSLSKNLKLNFVLDCIKQIPLNHNNKDNIVILHSDQGIHYRSNKYQKLLQNLNIIQSMSAKGNAIDNAPIESFFGHLKDEIDFKKCTSYDEVKNLIDNYVYYYNYKRYQWDKMKMTPIQYKNYLLAI